MLSTHRPTSSDNDSDDQEHSLKVVKLHSTDSFCGEERDSDMSDSGISATESGEHLITCEVPPDVTCCSKILLFFSNITVEVPLFLFIFAWALEGLLQINLFLEKTCEIHFNYSLDVCLNLTSFPTEEANVQRYVNKLNLAISLLENIPGVILVLYLGSWSDKYSRKIPLLLPQIGNLISSLLILLNIVLWTLPPKYMVLAFIPKSVTGSMTCLAMVSNSYIVDITDEHTRSTRISMMQVFFGFGVPCGFLLSNILFSRIGYSGTYAVSCFMYLLSIVYIIIRIKETRGPWAKTTKDQLMSVEQEPSGVTAHSCERSTGLRGVFSFDNIKESFVETFRKREHHTRAIIILLIFCVCLIVVVISGSNDFLYFQKKFSWQYQDFVHWLVAKILFSSICLAIIFPLLSRTIGVNDILTAIFGCLCYLSSKLMQAFGVSTYQMYIAALMAFFEAVPIVVCRSLLSKCTLKRNTGKIFAVMASLETLFPLVGDPCFTYTYNATLDFFPEAYLLLSSAILIVATVLFICVYLLNRRHPMGRDILYQSPQTLEEEQQIADCRD